MNSQYVVITSITLTVVTLFLAVSIQSGSGYNSQETKNQQPLLSIISTRDTPIFSLGHLTKLVSDTITKFSLDKSCPSDILIYIHGYNKNKDDAGEEFNRIQASLKHNNYTKPMIGFSWNSNVPWEEAKVNAKNSGGELVKFILAFNYLCPPDSQTPAQNRDNTTDIHLVAHSLGAGVVNSTLMSLDTYLNANTTSNNTKVIKSVHLLGAAINNLSIGKGTPLGNAIENVVGTFYNFYNPEDDGLQFNKFFEKHNPLGLAGAPKGFVPSNYNDTNVINEIPAISDADGDGNLEECFEESSPVLVEGDNHCGYIGFRQPFSNSLLYDGAMNIVVPDLEKP